MAGTVRELARQPRQNYSREETKELELYEGLSFKGYQIGDVIIVKHVDLVRKCPFMHGWREFHEKLLRVGKILRMRLDIEHKQHLDEYHIEFKEFTDDYPRATETVRESGPDAQDYCPPERARLPRARDT